MACIAITQSAVNLAIDCIIRKNEAIYDNLFCFIGLVGGIGADGAQGGGFDAGASEIDSLLDGAVLRFCALGLQFAEELQVFVECTIDALFVEGQQLKRAGFFAEDAGLGEGGVDLGVIDIDIAGFFEMAEGEEVVFGGAAAIETPVIFGDGLGEAALVGGFGREVSDDFGAVGDEGGAGFVGHDGDLAGDAMLEGVHSGTAATAFGSGAGGFLGVTKIGGDLGGGCHGDGTPYGSDVARVGSGFGEGGA